MKDGQILEHPTADSLIIKRWFPAPPSLLYRLWTEPEHLARWWGPVGLNPDRVVTDRRPGGAWEIDLTGRDGAVYRLRGRYLELEEGARVVSTWAWMGADGTPGVESRYDAAFVAEGDGARLTLTHTGLPADQAASHGQGWTACLDSLDAEVSATRS